MQLIGTMVTGEPRSNKRISLKRIRRQVYYLQQRGILGAGTPTLMTEDSQPHQAPGLRPSTKFGPRWEGDSDSAGPLLLILVLLGICLPLITIAETRMSFLTFAVIHPHLSRQNYSTFLCPSLCKS